MNARRKVQLFSNPTENEKSSLGPLWVAIIGAGGILAGAAINSYYNHLSSKQQTIQSCIARLDDQEKQIRKKTEELLGAIGDLSSKTAEPGLDNKGFHQVSQAVVRSAFELTAYTPPALGFHALKLAVIVRSALVAKTPVEEDQAITAGRNSMDGWHDKYYSLMQEFEDKRKACQAL